MYSTFPLEHSLFHSLVHIVCTNHVQFMVAIIIRFQLSTHNECGVNYEQIKLRIHFKCLISNGIFHIFFLTYFFFSLCIVVRHFSNAIVFLTFRMEKKFLIWPKSP